MEAVWELFQYGFGSQRPNVADAGRIAPDLERVLYALSDEAGEACIAG